MYYLKAILSYKFKIFDTYLPNTPYLREQGCKDPLLFFEDKRRLRAKTFAKHWYTALTAVFFKQMSRVLFPIMVSFNI
jgi:hypothetical protein